MSEMLSQEKIDAFVKGNSMPDAEKDKRYISISYTGRKLML